jgi:hypothetical protein
MSDLDSAKILSDWAAGLDRRGEIIEISRQTGTSPNSVFKYPCRARVKGFRPAVLIASVIQGEITIWAFYPDLVKARFPLPVLNSDAVWVRGAQRKINAVDNNTGRNGNIQIYVKISAVG